MKAHDSFINYSIAAESDVRFNMLIDDHHGMTIESNRHTPVWRRILSTVDDDPAVVLLVVLRDVGSARHD